MRRRYRAVPSRFSYASAGSTPRPCAVPGMSCPRPSAPACETAPSSNSIRRPRSPPAGADRDCSTTTSIARVWPCLVIRGIDGLNERSTTPYCATAVSAPNAAIRIAQATKRETKTQTPRKEPDSTLMLFFRSPARKDKSRQASRSARGLTASFSAACLVYKGAP